MKSYTFLLILLLAYNGTRAQDKTSPATSEAMKVETIVQAGHRIESFDVSPDQKYVATSDAQSVAIWDLEKRRIIKRISFANRGVRFNAINPKWLHIRPVIDYTLKEEDATYYTYDIFTGKQIGVKKGKDLLKQKKTTENYVMELKDGIIVLKSRNSLKIVGMLDGNYGTATARIAINYNDSLLMLSGLLPPIWDLKNATLVGHIPYLNFLKQDSTLYFYNDQTIPLPKNDTHHIRKRDFQYGYRNFYEGYFTPDDQILLGGFNPYITRWNLQGQLLEKTRTDGAPVFAFTDNGKYRVAATYKGLNMGKTTDYHLKECKEFNNQSEYKLLYQISPVFRKKYFFTGGDDNHLLMGELGNPRYRKTLMSTAWQPMCYSIDKEENYVLVSGEMGYLVEVPINNPKATLRYKTTAFKNSAINCCSFLDNQMLAAGCSDGIIGFWQRGNPEPVNMIRAHTAGITDVKLTHNRKWMLSADRDGSICIWDAQSLKPFITIHQIGNGNDYIFLTTENFYKASKGIFDKIHFVKGMEIYSFDQFDLKYNRPDIVLQKLDAPAKQIEIYYKAWQKRVKKMGYTESMLSNEVHAPEVTVMNKRDIPASTSSTKLSLQLKAHDSKYKLKRFFISLNGVPILGVKGEDISKLSTPTYNCSKDINLAIGNNRIDIFCLNEKGVESYKKQIEVYCDKPAQKPDLYIATIGVSKYSNKAYNLNYAAKDAIDFAQIMKAQSNNRFARIHGLTITDELFTNASLQPLKDFFAQGKRDDMAILFYAGHGILNTQMDYFLSTHNMNFDLPEQEGVSYEDFESIIDSIEPIHKLCFIDACHSGEIDKDDYQTETAITVPAGKIVFRNAGVGIRKLKPNGVEQVKTLVQELFLDIRWGIGATILSSAGGMEVAIEGNQWKNGLFTWCLKKGILEGCADLNNDKQITMNELANYVRNEVNTLSNGVQTPNVRLQNKLQDFVLIKQ